MSNKKRRQEAAPGGGGDTMKFQGHEWRRYSEVRQARTEFNTFRLIRAVLRYSENLWKISGFWVSYKTTPKYRWVKRLHVVVLVLMTTAAVTVVASTTRFWRLELSVQTMHIFDQTVASLQSAICLYILLNWQREKVLRKFINQINNNTLGAGIAKHYPLIRTTRYVLFTAICAWTFGWIAYFGLFYAWNHSCWPGQAFNLFVDPNLNPAAFVVIVYSEVCCIVAKTFVALTYVIVLAEFLSLNADLVNDVNLNQLAVLRHYFGIHGKLRQTLQYLNQSYQPFNTAVLVLDASLIQLNTLVLLSQRVELFDAIFAAATSSFAFIEILFLASLSMCLKAKVRFIFDRIHYLSATSIRWEHEVMIKKAGVSVGLNSALTVNTLIKGLLGFSVITGFLMTFHA